MAKGKNAQPAPSVEEFLSAYPKQVRAVAERLRKIIERTVPEYTEAVYPGWKLIGYRVMDGSKSHYFGFIAPLADRAVLGFEYGNLLDDPHHLLTGKGKQVRQVELRTVDEIDEDALAPFVTQGAHIALTRHGSRS